MKIIIPATVEPITLATARRQCRVDAEGSPAAHEDDELIALFLSAAREWCESYLGRIVAPTLVETAFNAFADTMRLESGPVLAVDSILYTDVAGIEMLVNPLTYSFDNTDPIAVVRRVADATWPIPKAVPNVVRIRYSVGYATAMASPQDAPLPASIKVAILLILGHLYANRQNSVEKNLSTIPMGATAFLSPLKLRRGFA